MASMASMTSVTVGIAVMTLHAYGVLVGDSLQSNPYSAIKKLP